MEPRMNRTHALALSIAAGLVIAMGGIVVAQDATLTSPITHATEAKYKIRGFCVVNPAVGAPSASIDLSSQDSGNNEITVLNRTIPGCGTATVAGLATAMVTVRPTETGSDTRRLQFRIIGYLGDQGCLPASTLNP